MGIGGLGIGDWGLGIGPNPQSPIPNPQSPIPYFSINYLIYIIHFFYLFYNEKCIIKNNKSFLYNKLNKIIFLIMFI
jgi:hypothetical protein